MKRLFLAGLIACLSVAASARAAPLEAYGRLPQVEGVRISPDGKHIAVIATANGEARSVLVRRVDDGQLAYGIMAGDTKLRDLAWAGPEHIVITTSRTASAIGVVGPKQEYFMALLVNITTKKSKALLSDQPRAMNVIIGDPEVRTVNGKLSVFVRGITFPAGKGVLTLFRHDVKSGRTVLVETGNEDLRDIGIGADGRLVARTTYDERTARWTLRLAEEGGWKVVATETLPFGPARLRGLGRTPNSVVVMAPGEDEGPEDDGDPTSNEPRLREYRLDGFTDLDERFAQTLHDPALNTLIGGLRRTGDEASYVFFDSKADATWRAITKAYPGQRVELASWSDDRRKIVVKIDDPANGPGYALVDLNAKKADWLTDTYAGLREADISPVRAIRYKAADGLEISGYLTLPRGKPEKGLPLIVLPHGGPAARDYPGFDWWAQALASRGYAVLQPNFRGSDGLGIQLFRAGYGQWGRKMQTDLSDGVADLVRQGIADPKRVCIVGGSYGGYAALAGVTVHNGLYRCAVSVAGVADLRRMLEWSRNRTGGARRQASQRYWNEFMGIGGARDPDLLAISPAQLAAKADAPVLLIHGKDDTVVPFEQTRLMAEALNKAGKRYEVVTLNGEDHWLSRGDTRLQMLQATVAFLERENPPR